MKGIIFNIMEEFLTDQYGEEKLDEIISSCSLSTTEPFVAPGTYPDSDLFEIVGKASEKISVDVPELLRRFGRYAFGKLASRYPGFVKPYAHPKEFLKTVDGVIHVEVLKLYSDSLLPSFQYAEPSPSELVITYHSPRKLYPFMEGLIAGVGDHFGSHIEQHHKIFVDNGIEYCNFYLRFND